MLRQLKWRNMLFIWRNIRKRVSQAHDDRRLDASGLGVSAVAASEPPARHGDPVLAMPRLGQGDFRVCVTDAYRRRCAITGESMLPVLEAVHILPVAENGPHEGSNGLLLRSDFHKLFDTGLVTVTPDLCVEVSPRIRDAWLNGKAYNRLDGKRLASIPAAVGQQPDANLLR